MKTKILVLFFFSFTTLLSAQEKQRKPKPFEKRSHIKWGDRPYYKSFKGIKMLMRDVKKEDPELYLLLNPEYKSMRTKNGAANLILTAGLFSGAGLLVRGTITESINIVIGTQTQEETKGNQLFIVAGVLVWAVSGIAYSQLKVKPSNIVEFSKTFNQHSTGDQMKITLRPDIDIGNYQTVGLNFSLQF